MADQAQGEQLIPVSEAIAELEVRRSRFIAHARPIENPDQLKEELEGLRARYPDATHVAYAFVTGTRNSETLGMSDAGEPKGTAGRPILDVIRGRSLTNTLILVVRYFGGTKLGTGGLSRAYGECAALAADRLSVRPLVATVKFSLLLPYELFEPALRIIERCDARELQQSFSESVEIRGELPEERVDRCRDALADLSRGQLRLEIPTDRERP